MSVRGETPEKKWLDAAILTYIEKQAHGAVGVFEGNILEHFAPTTSTSQRASLTTECPDFGARVRRVQKEMVEASIRRLMANGRIGVAKIQPVRRKGQYEAVDVRLFKIITVLDALADAGA
jgi:hypothetical protein